MRRKPAVILDRDGVINYDSLEDYVIDYERDVKYIPGSLEAMRKLREAGREVYLATNQAWVSQGLRENGPAVVRDTLTRLRLRVKEEGGLLHGVGFCPHQDDDCCACRKPQPGILLKLQLKYGLDLSRSVMVGDSWRDVEAAAAAGVGSFVFVRTRPTEQQVEAELQRCRPPAYQAANLAAAVEIILREGLGSEEG